MSESGIIPTDVMEKVIADHEKNLAAQDSHVLMIPERIGIECVQAARVGRRIRRANINPLDFWTIARAMSLKVDAHRTAPAEITDGLTIHMPAGSVAVDSDPSVYPGTIFYPNDLETP